MKLQYLFILAVGLMLSACGPNEEAELTQTIDNLETAFDAEPPAPTPDRPAPPPAARKQLQEQVKQASNLMREQKYEEAVGVLNNVRRSPYITADEKPHIDDAMRKSQKSMARLLQQGGLSAAEEARIRQQLGR